MGGPHDVAEGDHTPGDGASGAVLALHFRPTEDLHGYAMLFAHVFSTHGLPVTCNGDGTSLLVRNDAHWSLAEELRGTQDPTHLGRVLAELGIEYIRARSPQAKGRIERLWRTQQDRLRAELRLRGIGTLAAATAALPTFVADYNRRFAHPPAEPTPAWRRAPRDLALQLSCRCMRTVARDNIVRLGPRLAAAAARPRRMEPCRRAPRGARRAAADGGTRSGSHACTVFSTCSLGAAAYGPVRMARLGSVRPEVRSPTSEVVGRATITCFVVEVGRGRDSTIRTKGRAMRQYAVEFVGTFFLVLTIGCTGLAAAPGVIAPLAIGAVLMAMIYAGGHISGAHYNPAVTLGVFLRGRCPASDVLPYWGAQLLGAAGAAWIVGFALRGAPVTPFNAPVLGVFLAESLFTFALVYVVLNVATADATDGNSYFGLAIGFTVLAGAFAVGQVSGAAFNPAVAFGASIRGLLPWSNLWLYIVAELLGGAAAAFAFKALNPTSRPRTA